MIVYRVEHKETGKGPYRGLQSVNAICTAHCASSHPTLWEEIWDSRELMVTLADYETGLCGFRSLRDLRKWFKGFLRLLKKHNFVIRAYETETYAVGKKQVFFVPERAYLKLP